MKRIFVFLLLLCSSFSIKAQTDSSRLRISLLTCSAGEELYSIFGHSALRVIDSSIFTDRVYNYGTFDFNPDFYGKFIRGKLLDYLSVENFPDFLYAYQLENRSIVEQVLNLSEEEKLKLNAALILNARGKNKFYKYDFLFDNCSTRIRDILKENVSGPVEIRNILPYEDVTFRDLIHYSLNQGRMYWSKLGIDILLGRGLDKPATNEQTMFLPDYLFKGFDSATIGNAPLVNKVNVVYEAPSHAPGEKPFFTPFVVFSIVFFIFLALSLTNINGKKQILAVFDFILFLSAGLAGILLIFMWTGTDHQLCRNNYNLVWAIPFHTVAAFFPGSKKKIMHRYWAFVFLVYLTLLVFWVWLPQELNKDLLPVIVLLAWRSWKQFKRLEDAKKAV